MSQHASSEEKKRKQLQQPQQARQKASFGEHGAAQKEGQQQQQQQPSNTQADQSQGPQSSQKTISRPKRLLFDCLLYLVKAVVNVYDLISQPVHFFKYDVYKKRHEFLDDIHSEQIDPSDPCSPWRRTKVTARQLEVEAQIDSHDTIDQLIRSVLARNPKWPCYGYRKLLDEQWVKRSDGSDKLMKRVRLSNYNWVSYADFERQIQATMRGFLLEGVRAGDRVMIYSDTRAEWQVSAQALMRMGAIVVTMYSTLGIDGVIHSVNETEVKLIIAQKDKVGRLLRIKDKLPHLRKIIYFEPVFELARELNRSHLIQYWDNIRLSKSYNPEPNGRDTLRTDTNGTSSSSSSLDASAQEHKSDFEHPQVECMSFARLLDNGLHYSPFCESLDERHAPMSASELRRIEEENESICGRRTKDSVAVIMYTSGSTGIPKGVLITHRSILATLKAFTYVTRSMRDRPCANISVAYLPLAHIFEFSIELVGFLHNVPFGFGTPHTLTDKSPGLEPGELGDLSLLQPTQMIIVPLVLDRVVQSIKQALHNESYFKEQLVTYLIDYKSYWQQRHYETPLVDRIVCAKIRAALGGRATYLISGSAPLSPETQQFARTVINCHISQGFGTTETCANTSCQDFQDQSTGNVGLPNPGVLIRLEPWLEGNYHPSDKPHPRGEVVVGGDCIAAGYFKLEQATEEAFYVDEAGIRWYRTGDIGEFLPDGKLRIIDRKKDLVKLQNGEYISLGKVESTLKSNPYTDNFCVFVNSDYNFVVALGPANQLAVRQLARRLVGAHSALARSSSGSDIAEEPDEPESGAKARLVEKGGEASGSDGERAQSSSSSASSSSRLPHNGLANGAPTRGKPPAGRHDKSELKALLATSKAPVDEARQRALDDLSQVLAEYEALEGAANSASDTNNNVDRRMSELSTRSEAGCTNELLARLCDNALVQEHVLEQLRQLAVARGLGSLEVPKRMLLLAEEWTEDKNLVTAAMKIRRNYIYKRYQKQLAELYESAASKH